MRLLLDTHFVLALLRRELAARYPSVHELVSIEATAIVSTATLWEIAIKSRLGKLDAGMPLPMIPEFLVSAAMPLLHIDDRHAIAEVDPEPATRDPFDRMLLAQCKVEGLQLVTLDRALVEHPLAWRA